MVVHYHMLQLQIHTKFSGLSLFGQIYLAAYIGCI